MERINKYKKVSIFINLLIKVRERELILINFKLLPKNFKSLPKNLFIKLINRSS